MKTPLDFYPLDGSLLRRLLAAGAALLMVAGQTHAAPGPVPLVPAGSVWKYLDTGLDQGAAWVAPNFNDGGWRSGPAQLGYGDGDEVTAVSFGPDPNQKYVTTYFRHTFVAGDVGSFTNLNLWLLVDDGAVVYLNGTEVFRCNLPAGGITFSTVALAVGENSVFSVALVPTQLVVGTNVIAVEVHQNVAASTDLSFDLALTGNSGTPQPPVISQTPFSQTRYVGQNVTFSVTATGSEPLTYQWQFYTWPIAAATNATLNLFNLQTTNSGYYRVIVTNVAGAVTSSVAQLEVFEPPTQPGQIDPLFSARLSHRGYVDALAQQPDGRCYVAGFFDQINGVGRGSLARLWPNGEVDLSFVPPPCLTVNALAVQPDDKVLANLGFSGVPSRVARLHSDGSLDTTFVPYTNAATSVLAVQPDGRILVASRYPVRRLVRLNSDGRPDPSFNVAVDGVVVDYAIRAVTPLPNGQLLIGGGFNNVNGIARGGVARLNTDGTVDPTFNPVANPDAWVNCLTVLPNGKILIAGGFGWQNNLPRRAIARLNPDGSLDPAFDPGAGIGPGDVEIHSIAAQADGRVLIGGNFLQVSGVPRNGLARLNPDGRLDTSFIDPSFSSSEDTRIPAILIQSADKALVAGDDPAYVIGLVRVYLGPMAMPPTIVTQPASQTRFVGQTATFSAEASGTPPLRYQWQYDGVPIAGATNSSFVIGHSSLADAGSYSVVVSNSAGSVTSAAALLTVQTIPTTFPSSVNFACNCQGGTGYSSSNYELPTPDDLPAELHVVAVYEGPAHVNGTVAVRVNATNKPVVLALSAYQPVTWAVTAGPGARVEAVYVSGYGSNAQLVTGLPLGVPVNRVNFGTYCYGWEYGHNTGGGSYSTMIQGVRQTTDMVETSFQGCYAGVTFEIPYLTEANRPPRITRQPAAVTVMETLTATFSVEAAGSAPLFYQWRWFNQYLPGATNATLVLTNVQIHQAGQYLVEVRNLADTVTSLPAQLTVEPYDDPSIIEQPASKTNLVGQTAAFTVVAIGQPLAYRWLKDGEFLTDGGRVSGVTTATLSIADLQLNDTGVYAVYVSNPAGDVFSDDAALTVLPMLTGPGSIDFSFRPGVILVAYEYVRALAVQADGKILVGGDFHNVNGETRFDLARLNPDGTLDETFNWEANWFFVDAVVIQPDGKILVAAAAVTTTSTPVCCA